MTKPSTPEAPPPVNTLPEQFTALQSQITDFSAGLAHIQVQLKNHQHTGTQYSRVNNGDLFHTRPTLALLGSNTSVSFDPHASDVFTITPSTSLTIVPTAITNGGRITIVVKTSGTTSYTITFGSGFTASSTLSTGTVSGVYFTITFAGDGVNLREVGRTAAMTPS